ncbi:Plasmodium exported protein, unknown function [Plasmodium sp. gorilla clade G2]|uniref:Plasmodium exported protein, unknown function n=1 Tax=Plasmodium sp. gorilla clade G2 TaxID=880535 RepID=UPI000D27F299|nr:Plasmodium exported protein, unknown function [Plasmodium sp. gorilla clade G2]SOV20165.1 Plasmodium exported protein, unknown function [Plasmodium sp. gorilla clade G2]
MHMFFLFIKIFILSIFTINHKLTNRYDYNIIYNGKKNSVGKRLGFISCRTLTEVYDAFNDATVKMLDINFDSSKTCTPRDRRFIHDRYSTAPYELIKRKPKKKKSVFAKIIGRYVKFFKKINNILNEILYFFMDNTNCLFLPLKIILAPFVFIFKVLYDILAFITIVFILVIIIIYTLIKKMCLRIHYSDCMQNLRSWKKHEAKVKIYKPEA